MKNGKKSAGGTPKKLLCAIMAAALVFAALPLAACGEQEENSSDGGELNIVDDNYRNWYEIFVYSYYDTNNDGYGDLNGVTAKLDYIRDMGYNGIWLMPVCQSDTYHKYDVTDYYTVDRQYGDNDDFKTLVAAAHERGINVIVDLVLNHTASSNAWFQKAVAALKGEASDGEEKYAEYYNFSSVQTTGYSPVPGVSGQYYECRFSDNMPDLNLDSAAVREEIGKVIDFWLTDMGADGFRLDACTSYYTGDVAKNVEFMSFVNKKAKSVKEDAYIVGEVWEGTDAQIRAYYESGVDSCFLFTAAQGDGTVRRLFSSLNSHPGEDFADLLLHYQSVYDKGTLAPFLCNHDTARAANFLLGDTVKMGAGVLALMSGNVFVYYGDEIGMISASDSDPTKRIAMRWQDKNIYEGLAYMPPQNGMIVNSSSYKYPSVETQEADPSSILNYYRQAMRLRNRHPEIARGTAERLAGTEDYVAAVKKTWKDSSVYIFVNFSDLDESTLDLSVYGEKPVLCDTLDVGEKSVLNGTSLKLKPYSVAVVRF